MLKRYFMIIICGVMITTGCVRGGKNNSSFSDENIQKIFAMDGEMGDRFGEAVDIHGDKAIIGAPFHDFNRDERDSGAAYILTRNSNNEWDYVAKLTGTPGKGEYFGTTVAILGKTAIVGAPFAGTEDIGAAYIFIETQEGKWELLEKITPTDIDTCFRFGCSVAISEETILIGATQANNKKGLNTGAVYLFTKDENGNWIFKTKICSKDGKIGDQFGNSLSVSKNQAIIGSIYNDEIGINSGASYIFKSE